MQKPFTSYEIAKQYVQSFHAFQGVPGFELTATANSKFASQYILESNFFMA